MFNFEQDHEEIFSELEDPKERGYIREFYMRFTTRGIYPSDLAGRTKFRSIEDELNSKLSLKELVVNTILSTNNENLIKSSIENAPIDTYHVFLKCALYTLNDFAVEYLVENWPFESLELMRYFQDAYSCLLLFYCTDISSYSGQIAPEVHKWFLIGDKYVRMVTKIFLKNRLKENARFRKLDISGLPISSKLFSRLIDLFYKHVFNHESIFKPPNAQNYESDLIRKENNENGPQKGKKRKKKSDDEAETESSGNSHESADSDSDGHDFWRCIRKTYFYMSDEDSDEDDEFDDDDEDESWENESLPSLEEVQDGTSDESSKNDRDLEPKPFKTRFKPNKTKLVLRMDFDETYSTDFHRFAKCYEYMSEVGLNPNELMFDLSIVRLNMTIQNVAHRQLGPSFDQVAKRINGLSLFFTGRPAEATFVFSIIKKFPNITELNVSAYGNEQQLQTLLRSQDLKTLLHESLSGLAHLKRLRINGLELAASTRLLLGGLKQPLEYLNLTSCHLDCQDIEYLTDSIHTNSLRVLILSNVDLEPHTPRVCSLLAKCSRTLEVLDLGCNQFPYDAYMSLINEIVKMPRLKLLVTLNVFTFDNYLKMADKLNTMRSLVAWRVNFSTDYYQQSVKIRSKSKFKKFKNEYLKSLQNKFDSRPVKITINDPDINFILNEMF